MIFATLALISVIYWILFVNSAVRGTLYTDWGIMDSSDFWMAITCGAIPLGNLIVLYIAYFSVGDKLNNWIRNQK